MPHPLADFLEACREPRAGFARRAGIAPERLDAILSGAETPDLPLARRLAAAAGGAIALADLYAAGGGAVLDARRPPAAVDTERLRSALSAALKARWPQLSGGVGEEVAAAAAEAAANTYDALGPVTNRGDRDRLVQALRAVLGEILKDCGAHPPARAIAAAARRIVRLYLA